MECASRVQVYFLTVQTLMNTRPLTVSSAFKEKHYVKTGGSGEFYYRLGITANSSNYVESIACSELVRALNISLLCMQKLSH